MERYFHFVLGKKKLLSGIAIVMVLCYHLLCIDETVPIYWLFYAGFIGVDIFMFYSGFSLCYSYEKNHIGVFYQRRIKRIAPIFLVLAIGISILYVLRGFHLSAWDWLCNISTLSYYQLGGQFVDWYLSSLFVFYLVFPVLYKIVRKTGWGGQFLISLLICFLLAIYDIPWYYGAAFARIPMFMMGILLFNLNKDEKMSQVKKILWYGFPLAFSTVLYAAHTNIGGYMITDMLTPFLLLGVGLIFVKLDDRVKKIVTLFELLGDYSLEIYVSNVIVMMIVKTWAHGSLNIFLSYMLLTFFMAFFVINLNKLLTKIISKRE